MQLLAARGAAVRRHDFARRAGGRAAHLHWRRPQRSRAALSRRTGASRFEGLPARDPRQPALVLFVQALGGGTSSRLFQELREERGLAYSIYAWNQAFADTGLVGIGCAAERRQAVESVQLARDVLAGTGKASAKPSSTAPARSWRPGC